MASADLALLGVLHERIYPVIPAKAGIYEDAVR